MSDNKFSKSMKALKSEEQKNNLNPNTGNEYTSVGLTEQTSPLQNKSDLIDSIFPNDPFKIKSKRAHSIYIEDETWDKLESLAKCKGITTSVALQKILDSIL